MPKFRYLLKNRNFLLLMFGQIISQVGDRLGLMALFGLVYWRTGGSTLENAKLIFFTIIPVFLIGPLAGVYVDRWDRRRTMYACDILRAALILAIPLILPFVKNLIPVYLLIFLVFSLSRFFVPAKLSLIPEIVGPGDLLLANSLVNISGMIATVFGFGISGLIVEGLGPEGGFYLDALSFLLSAFLIFLIAEKHTASMNLRRVGKEIVEVIKKSVIQEIKDGALYFMNNKDIRAVSGVIFALSAAVGAVYVAMIVFIQKALHSATKDLGLLAMFIGAGLFFGSLIYGRFGSRLSRYKIIFCSLSLSGIMLLVFVVTLYRYPQFWLAAALSLGIGFTVSPILIASNHIIQEVSANNMLGKVFSSLEVVIHLGFLLFMFASGILAEKFAEVWILAVVASVIIIIGIINLICHRKIAWLDSRI